ncbi:HAD-IA family hydrolase [Shewanella sp. SNU WT4]|uniref:HAD-IA family hydrolase n=1 Tax=Shewanella sp. SNU WT4 TaxID=2590015 RepID=UPI0011271CB7|nr:HAD-IA family hydrolase [Shewanella sp. SNU WT4]QDF68356.1 HAD-IA family hydrolase [Shewanella sp. SNU WT4]
MQILLRPQPFAAISFDLDDTLYDNGPIIRQAQQSLDEYLRSKFPALMAWSSVDWLALKAQLIRQTPWLDNDATAARTAVLTHALQQIGVKDVKAEVAHAMAVFLHHRSNFKVAPEVIALLNQLGHYYPLIGITNGNVDHVAIGLGEPFRFVIHPSQTVAKKPASDMFMLACQRLNITPAELLHVGDHPESDVMGARWAQCQSVWLSPAFGGKQRAEPKLLPTFQIQQLSELSQLLPAANN